MSVTDRQVERYGANAPRTDLQPCLHDATHGITACDCTQHLCKDHVAPTLYGTKRKRLRVSAASPATLRVRIGAPCRLLPDALGAC